MKLSFSILPERLAVCRLAPDRPIPEPPHESGFWSVTRTDEEISVVMPADSVPDSWEAERGWRALMVEGPLAFDVVGALVSICSPLAEAGIPVFVVSTYDTDFVLVKEQNLDRAIAILGQRTPAPPDSH